MGNTFASPIGSGGGISGLSGPVGGELSLPPFEAPNKKTNGRTNSVNFYIEIPGSITASTNKVVPNASPIYGFTFELDCYTDGSAQNPQFNSAAIQASNVKVSMANDGVGPQIANLVASKKFLQNISLYRLTNDGQTNQTMHKYVFAQVRLESIKVENDRIVIVFSYNDCQWTYTEYDQKTGQKKGNKAATWSLAENTVADGAGGGGGGGS